MAKKFNLPTAPMVFWAVVALVVLCACGAYLGGSGGN